MKSLEKVTTRTMTNTLDKQYTDLLQDILDNGVKKETRNGKTLSVFGRNIRYKFKDGKFPLLTTKRIPFKTIVTELLWFLRGDTNIKYLVDNNCHIWDGDAYKASQTRNGKCYCGHTSTCDCGDISQSEFIERIKNDDEFAKTCGELGPIYGRQWRNWNTNAISRRSSGTINEDGIVENMIFIEDSPIHIDQIANLINELKTNPDSRRLMVNAWNVGELDQMVLPPCHYGFQVYTRELSLEERENLMDKIYGLTKETRIVPWNILDINKANIPTRTFSLMWNQRSVDTFLGLPFNIASYGLLLEIIAKAVNMVPDELIGNLGDVHLYSNHVEQAKKQIGREFTEEEIQEHLMQSGMDALMEKPRMEYISKLPKRTREPFPLPTLNINTEFWLTKTGECGVGDLTDNIDALINGMQVEDFQIENYQSHGTIKAPLSN